MLLVIFGHLLFGASSSQAEPRQEKQGLFNRVSFPNLPCRGSNGFNGTCISASECVGTGGQAQGSCATGFGTCCFYFTQTCGGSYSRNQTYVQNVGFPSSYTVSADTTCTYTFSRVNDNVCQLRFDFIQFDLGPPYYSGASNYQCDPSNTDYITFTPAGSKYNNIILCGYNPGQHVYIDMGTSRASPNTVKMTMSFDGNFQANYARIYNIMVSQIECNTNYYAPLGCDQYFYGNNGQGVIRAFNYDNPYSGTGFATRIQGSYTVCVRREKTMCKIGYSPPAVTSESKGFSMSGSSILMGRMSCGSHQSYNGGGAVAVCLDAYIRIPQGTMDGNSPFFTARASPYSIQCDRFCGQRLCNANNNACRNQDHMTIYSKVKPFQMFVESDNQLITLINNRGFKLNYFQSEC